MVQVVVGGQRPEVVVVLGVLRRVNAQEQVDCHLFLCIFGDRGGEGEGRRGVGRECSDVGVWS